jgi:hypothetical protein
VELEVVDQRIYALDDRLTPEGAKAKAEDSKTKAFGLVSGFLMGARKGDIELTYVERRYEPFWHILCTTHIEYNRARDYEIPLDVVVREVVVDGRSYDASGGRLRLRGVENCSEDIRKEVYMDAVSGHPGSFQRYVESGKREIKETEELMSGDDVVVPAKVKASYITRSLIAEMLKPVKADDVTEERIRVEKLHLYFRPVYAFEYRWPAKDKTASYEVDAVTLGGSSGGKPIRQKMRELISEPDLFDIGADAVGMIVPGGSLALKIAKKVARGR